MNTNKHEFCWSLVLGRLRKHRVKLFVTCTTVMILSVAAMLWADHVCQSAAAGRVFRSVDNIPGNDVALVLGTGRLTPRGNKTFTSRSESRRLRPFIILAKSVTCL